MPLKETGMGGELNDYRREDFSTEHGPEILTLHVRLYFTR